MKISRIGEYVKFSETFGEDYLTFVAKSQKDIRSDISTTLREKNRNLTCSQNCEENEQFNEFEKILYVFYNIYGIPTKYMYLYFDFEKNTISTENSKKIKIVESFEYTYKIQKTQIKSKNGISGFYKFIINAMHIDSPYNSSMFNTLENLFKTG